MLDTVPLARFCLGILLIALGNPLSVAAADSKQAIPQSVFDGLAMEECYEYGESLFPGGINYKTYVDDVQSAYYGKVNRDTEPPTVVLSARNLLKEYPEICANLNPDGSHTAKSIGALQGAVKGTIIHELMHICLGVPKEGEGSETHSCLHLAIDASVNRALCKVVSSLSKPPGDDGVCCPKDDLDEIQEQYRKTLCKSIKKKQDKWNGDPEKTQKAKDCKMDPSTANITDLLEDPGDLDPKEDCGVEYPDYNPPESEDFEDDKVLPDCKGCTGPCPEDPVLVEPDN